MTNGPLFSSGRRAPNLSQVSVQDYSSPEPIIFRSGQSPCGGRLAQFMDVVVPEPILRSLLLTVQRFNDIQQYHKLLNIKTFIALKYSYFPYSWYGRLRAAHDDDNNQGDELRHTFQLCAESSETCPFLSHSSIAQWPGLQNVMTQRYEVALTGRVITRRPITGQYYCCRGRE